MTKRYIVGGPPHSGKSTYVLSLTRRLTERLGRSALAVEFDVWSSSYPAFEGKIPFEGRPKRFGLDWDWQTPLDERIAQFNAATADVVFGDLPGAKIDAATDRMCREAKADGAIVVSRTLEGLKLWRQAFEERGVKVVLECLSVQGEVPLVLRDTNRTIDAAHPDVALLADNVLDPELLDAETAEEERRRFLDVFRRNYARRSRTTHGRDENLGGPLKKPLTLVGTDLRRRAVSNGERLATLVLETPRPAAWTPDVLRANCERWFDLANEGICGPEWYADSFGALAADAQTLTRSCGRPIRANPRYRLWTPEHTTLKVSPLLLEDEMDRFYGRLAELLTRAESRFPSWSDTIEAMAYADLMTDGELRPWLDGCGRVAVALVMWIAHVLGAPLPLFAESKEVHKMTIRDLDRHRLYFLESIRRAELEHP